MHLASTHYANNMLALLQQQSICFVPKDTNLPCVASLWSVEDFWATLKMAVYDGGWEVTAIRKIKEKAR